MEQEIFNENGLGNLDKKELMASIQGRCANQIKYNWLFTVLWVVVFLIIAASALGRNWKEWISVFTPLAVGLLCLFNALWYGKMSRCGDAKQLLSVFRKGYIWSCVVVGIAAAFIGYTLAFLTDNDLNERFGTVVFAAIIALFILAAFITLSTEFRVKSIKKNGINNLRKLEGI